MSTKPVLKVRRTRAARNMLRTDEPDPHFNVKTFEQIAADLVAKRIPAARFTKTRNGLLAEMRDTGAITYRAVYNTGDGRTTIKIGDHPAMDIKRAQKIAETIQYLASELGIDPKKALHERLVREIESQGVKWRP